MLSIELRLTVAEQRKIVEAECKGPVFRMWLTREELDRADAPDWTGYELSDGRWAVWRPQADLVKLQAGGEIKLWTAISERILADEVT